MFGWPSGLRRTVANRARTQVFRGFESHPVRIPINVEFFSMPPFQSKFYSSPSIRVAEFAGFLSIYNYQPGGLHGAVSPYLHGKRGSYFIVNPGKIIPIFRKGVSFSHSVGYFLGSVSLAGSSKNSPSSFFQKALEYYLDFCLSLIRGPVNRRAKFGCNYLRTLNISRFWKSPFRPAYYARWIPGAFTNFSNVVKAYLKKSSPKLVVYRRRLSKNLQSWFLPKWFPSFAGIFDMLNSAPAIRETARMGVPNMGVGAAPVGRITVAEITYPIIGYPSRLAGSVIFSSILQNYYKGLFFRFNEVVAAAYEKTLLNEEDAFPSTRSFDRKKADEIFSAEDYVRIVKSKVTYEDYLAEQKRLLAELQAERETQERIERFQLEDEELRKKNPKLADSKYRPTPVQRAVIFNPLMYSAGKPVGPRRAELLRRHQKFDQLKVQGKYSPEQLGTKETLNHGLYTDYFDSQGFLYPGRTLWNERPAPGMEDPVSKTFLRSYKGIRPDKINPNVDYGIHPPGSPKWDSDLYERLQKDIIKEAKRKHKNYKRNQRRKKAKPLVFR